MVSGILSTGDSTVVTKQMRYEADKEDNEDNELESNNGNNSTVNTTMHISFINHMFGPNTSPSNAQPVGNITQSNKRDLTLEDNTMNISQIEQDNDDLYLPPSFPKQNHQLISEKLRMITTPVQNITHQSTSTTIIDHIQTEAIPKNNSVKDDGFTIVQSHRKVYKKTSLEQLKKTHNIQKQGLPSSQVSFRNS
jgi:hypothetical protein